MNNLLFVGFPRRPFVIHSGVTQTPHSPPRSSPSSPSLLQSSYERVVGCPYDLEPKRFCKSPSRRVVNHKRRLPASSCWRQAADILLHCDTTCTSVINQCHGSNLSICLQRAACSLQAAGHYRWQRDPGSNVRITYNRRIRDAKNRLFSSAQLLRVNDHHHPITRALGVLGVWGLGVC